MWLDYFTNANIVSVDIRDEPTEPVFKNERFEYLKSDQIDILEVGKMIVRYREFFIIVDDASHVPEDQQFTLGYMFPFVESGGWYVIEDLKCRRSHSTRLPTCKKTIPVLESFKKTGKINIPCLTENQNNYLKNNVTDIVIYDKIAFMRKRDEY